MSDMSPMEKTFTAEHGFTVGDIETKLNDAIKKEKEKMSVEHEAGEILRRLTAAVREADRDFESSGGSSQHYVAECLGPALISHGLIVTVNQHHGSELDVDRMIEAGEV